MQDLVDYQYLELMCQQQHRSPTYGELLRTNEWFDKRKLIIIRDQSKCSICGAIATEDVAHERGKWNNVFLLEADYSLVADEDIEAFRKTLFLGRYVIKGADKAYWLHVHHKRYFIDKLPWQYEDEELITLCNWCHYDWHLNNIAPVFRIEKGTYAKIELRVCPRCSGAGILPQFKHYEGGICFGCHGGRYIGIESALLSPTL